MALGLYLHFPWCVRKCPYCDFNSHPLRGSLDERAYVDALLRDLNAALRDVAPGAITTVFCGGGTPSLFPATAFSRLRDAIDPWLTADAEITMEANPGTVEHHDFATYRRAGINRLSLGAQSFSAAQLDNLGRIHGADDVQRAFDKARLGGFDNINLDLMYGLPRQTAAQALDDLERALALAPEHVSWYQLTIEPRTEFARRPPRLATEAHIAEMEALGPERLAAAGYHRYEVSAFARDGYRCRHNLNYWTFGDYVGAGAGAHGKRSRSGPEGLAIVRTRKASQPRLYLKDPEHTETVPVARDQVVLEFLMNALRLVEGVSFQCFQSRTGLGREDLAPRWAALVDQGLLHADRVAATELGYRHLDGLLQRFL